MRKIRYFALLLGITSICALAGAEHDAKPEDAQQVRAITDKTLVAWVYLENTTQRGGSALTLIEPVERMDSARFAGGGGSGLKSEDQNECFDAVVFGELAAGKWMAGSDLFNRTLRDQAALPEETADAGTLVQMAIVDREMDFGTDPTFRLLLKKSVLEFYLNDILIECYSMPAKATGRIGLLGDVRELKAWNCRSAVH